MRPGSCVRPFAAARCKFGGKNLTLHKMPVSFSGPNLDFNRDPGLGVRLRLRLGRPGKRQHGLHTMRDAEKTAEPKDDERLLFPPRHPVPAWQDHSDTDPRGGFRSALNLQRRGASDQRDCSRREFINEDRAVEQGVRFHWIGFGRSRRGGSIGCYAVLQEFLNLGSASGSPSLGILE